MISAEQGDAIYVFFQMSTIKYRIVLIYVKNSNFRHTLPFNNSKIKLAIPFCDVSQQETDLEHR